MNKLKKKNIWFQEPDWDQSSAFFARAAGRSSSSNTTNTTTSPPTQNTTKTNTQSTTNTATTSQTADNNTQQEKEPVAEQLDPVVLKSRQLAGMLIYFISHSFNSFYNTENCIIVYQKLITYLKRVATIHFFGSMLRNIHFFLRNIFSNKSSFFMLQKAYRIVTKHIVIIGWQNLSKNPDKISNIPRQVCFVTGRPSWIQV